MKKSLVALAVLAASGAAMAQSSVTLFGIVDAGVTYAKTSGGESNYGLTNSGNATSRLGFRGVEDLGGGLKAGFWLEGAIQNDSGTASGGGAAGPGFEFKRRSTVSLMGNFGEVRLGRELTAAYNTVSGYDVFGQVGIGQNFSFGNGTYGFGDPVRVGNMVSYYTPNMSGFTAGVNYGFGETAGDSSAKRYIGVSAGYNNGPLSAGIAYDQQNDPTASFEKAQGLGLGAAYNFGAFKLSGLIRQVQSTPVGGGSKAKFQSAGLGATAAVGAAGEARLAYNYYDNKEIEGKAHQLSLGYVHNLSKRTALYGTYAFLKNQKSETMSLSANGLGIDPARAGKNQNAITVGVRHAF
ncbi:MULTISPECIES: porin [Comamonas]|jgi:predicted porin|uniref:Porin n=1 Tax=Comamonas squillarum TaxID=2977320 RepID=A0ABY5ZVN8_9BURK|nr:MULTISPECIES: porin [Comamonas]UXC18055.1 porin [Comamonas sp. PR12]